VTNLIYECNQSKLVPELSTLICDHLEGMGRSVLVTVSVNLKLHDDELNTKPGNFSKSHIPAHLGLIYNILFYVYRERQNYLKA